MAKAESVAQLAAQCLGATVAETMAILSAHENERAEICAAMFKIYHEASARGIL